MKKIIFSLLILTFLGLFLGVFLKGYDFIYSRSVVLCLSCMGLE